MLQGKIVMRSANEQSKSAGVFPYLELDNGELVKIRKVKDNPFENDNLKQYQDKFVVLQGEYNENNTFMVTEISEVTVDDVKIQTLNDKTYSYVRGLNYFSSNVTFLRDVTELYDQQLWERELGYAKKLGANTLRIWFDVDSHMRDEQRFIDVFSKIVAHVKNHGMKMMPVLYNCWTDCERPFGSLYQQEVYSNNRQRHYDYIKSVVGTFKNEDTILMWDLCNEPYSFEYSERGRNLETCFWLDLIKCFREVAPSQPLTMGTHNVVEHTPQVIFDALDVLSFHPYKGWENDTFIDTVLPYVEHANRMGKALVCTETFQGSLDDKTRSLCIERCKKAFKAVDVGYIGFQLMAGKMISSRKDWTDTNCAPGDRGYFPFVLEDGTVREGHSLL